MFAWGGTETVGRVDPKYNADPQALLDAEPVSPVSASALPVVVGGLRDNELTIDPAGAFTGRFEVEVTATDGAAEKTHSFLVTVL